MIDDILRAIDAELARLQQARRILAAGLPSSPAASRAPRRKLSPEARQAIADGQRKRWAKTKSQTDTTAG